MVSTPEQGSEMVPEVIISTATPIGFVSISVSSLIGSTALSASWEGSITSFESHILTSLEHDDASIFMFSAGLIKSGKVTLYTYGNLKIWPNGGIISKVS